MVEQVLNGICITWDPNSRVVLERYSRIQDDTFQFVKMDLEDGADDLCAL